MSVADLDRPEAPLSPEQQRQRLMSYFEASVREVVHEVYPARLQYHFTSEGELWEVEYQAWAYAHQFVESIADIDDDQRSRLRQMFAEAVKAAVNLKMKQHDIT